MARKSAADWRGGGLCSTCFHLARKLMVGVGKLWELSIEGTLAVGHNSAVGL